jgi:hypothetical protein
VGVDLAAFEFANRVGETYRMYQSALGSMVAAR